MFAITQAQRIRRDAERARRAYISSVRQLHAEIFNLSPEDVAKHDKAWLEWLKVPPHVWVAEEFNRDSPEVALIALLSDLSVDEAFRARALAGFFAPEAHWIPFGWSVKAVLGQERYRYYAYTPWVVVGMYNYGSSNGELDIDRILACARPSLRLLTFVWKIIPLSLAAARNVPQTPRDWGAEYWFRFGNYSDIILLALAQLSEDDPLAGELFDNYFLYGKELHLGPLLQAPIPLKWKILADKKVRALMQQSDDGITPKDRGLEREYRESINWFVGWEPDKLPYNISLFRSQVEFLLERGQMVFGNVGHMWGTYDSVHEVVSLIESDLDLCHRYCRRLVLKTPFIKEGLNEAAAERIMQLFGHTDIELHEKLSPVVGVITRRREDFARNEGAREEDRATTLAQVLAHTK